MEKNDPLIIYKAAVSADFPLVLIEQLFPASHAMLPIGGSLLAQIGVLFILAVTAHDANEIWASLFGPKSKRP